MIDIIRQEQKVILNETEIASFLNFKKARPQFPTRVINSIYYDDIDFACHINSEEGIVPRKKFRFRWYGQKFYKIPKVGSLEIKSTEEFFKKKKSIKIDDFFLTNDYTFKFFKSYNLRPTCVVSYRRNYYVNNKGERFTFDHNIVCSKIEKNITFKIPTNIFEIKYNGLNNGYYDNIFGEKLTRFSKYSEAINILYNLS